MRIKRVLQIIVIVTAVIVTLMFTGIGTFFATTDAPILNGDISYHIEFKENRFLDIYHPTKTINEKSPVLFFIHGGAWIGGRKESININRFNYAINQLREKGFTVISPEYTLGTKEQTPFPDCVLDVYESINWINDKADSLSLDMSKLGIMGESAGGHIAMLVAYSNPKNFGLNAEPVDINYVVDAYGPSDLYNIYKMELVTEAEKYISEFPEPLQDSFDVPKWLFGFDPKEDSIRTQEFIDFYSPINYLSKDISPTLIIHGIDDRLVPIQQSILLNSMLDSLQVENSIYTFKGVDHAFLGATSEQRDSIQNIIIDFVVNKNLK